MVDIAKYNWVAIANIAKINGIATSSIAKVNWLTIPSWSTPPTDNLQQHLTLDGASWLNDSSGNGNNAVGYNLTYTTPSGASQQVAVFNGTNAYVDLAWGFRDTVWDFTWDFSIAFAVYKTSATTDQHILSVATGSGGWYDYFKGVSWSLNDGTNNLWPVSFTISQNTWYSVVITYTASSDTIEVFLNDVSQGTASNTSFSWATTYDLAIWARARDFWADAFGFTGYVWDSRVYSDLLTSWEITTMHEYHQSQFNF